MPRMSFGPEQWRVLSPYLDQALDIPPEQRIAWLESIREKNPGLATDLQMLLKEQHELGDFLKTDAASRASAATQMVSEVDSRLRNLPPSHITFAALALRRGPIAQASGDLKPALDLVTHAAAIAEAWIKGHGEGQRSLQNALLARSGIQLQFCHTDEATNDARRARKIALDTTQSGTFSILPGRAYVALGRAFGAQGKREEANVVSRGKDH